MIKLFIKQIIYLIIELLEKMEYKNNSFDENNPLKKIINTIPIDNVSIETDYGFVPITEMNLTAPLSLYRLELDNGDWLECADDHIVFTEGHQQKFVKNLTTDDKVLCRENYIEGIKVKSVKNLKRKVSLMDITVDTNEKSYFANNILNHNTVSAAIVILHFCLFKENKGVMVVANKGKTTIEIIEKIKSIYKLLPFFLKAGIINWNQSSITFDNGCQIKTEKRTKEPAIGFTIDLLYLDEFAHIPENYIVPYYTAVVPVVSSIENSKIIITSTPKGLNLFHKLLIESELPEDDPNWNGYRSLRVYWWQVKHSRDTKIFFNEKKLRKYKLNKTELKQFLIENKYNIYEKNENNLNGIFINYEPNEESTQIDYIRNLRYNELPLSELGMITNWEEQQTKLIGGEDGFKQEYDLHFLTGNKMLFDSVLLEKMMEDKLPFEYYSIPIFNEKLKIPYNNLTFVKGQPELFDMKKVKDYHIFISIDLGEGLGQDYSVINIFRVMPKTSEELNYFKKRIDGLYDYFKLEQIGMFKSNIYSVKEVSLILYMITFELFNDNKVRIALERNVYGDELIAHMPHVFDDNNNYSSHVFLRYKHNLEQKTSRMGIKVNRNKLSLIKDYQIQTKKGNIVIRHLNTITELSTFTKKETPSGGITYQGESGHDDQAMTVIVLATIFNHVGWKNCIEEFMKENKDNRNLIHNDFNKIVDEYQADIGDIKTFQISYKKIYNKNYNPKNQKQVGYGGKIAPPIFPTRR